MYTSLGIMNNIIIIYRCVCIYIYIYMYIHTCMYCLLPHSMSDESRARRRFAMRYIVPSCLAAASRTAISFKL